MAVRSSADEIRVLSRRTKIAAMLVRGQTNQYEILRQLGMEPSQQSLVSRDIRAIKAEWRLSAVRDFDEMKGRELARLDALEQEAWQAWERSRQPREIDRRRRHDRPRYTKDDDGKEVAGTIADMQVEIRKEQRDGNVKFLELALSCIDRRCKLLGLDPNPKQQDATPPSSPKKGMTDDERQAITRNLLARLGGYLGVSSAEGPTDGDGPALGEPVAGDDPFGPDAGPVAD